MSIEASSWAWRLQGLTASQKLVLLALADHANEDGICWPGQKSISKKTGLSERTVKRARSDLEKKELISVERRPGKGGGNRSNRYILELGQSANLTPPHDKTGQEAKCQPDTPKVTPRHPQSATVTPKPTTEPPGSKRPPQGGCGFLWPEGLFSKRLEKTVLKISEKDRQTFLDEIFSNLEAGKITTTPERYAEGMVRNGWVPSEATQSSRRDQTINQRIDELQTAAKGGAIIKIGGDVIAIDDRLAIMDEATLPLGPLVGRELDGKIAITIERSL